MAPDIIKQRIQPALTQDVDAVWDEWSLEVERPDPIAFVEHLVAWSLVDPATAGELQRFLAGPAVGRIDDVSEDLEAEAATMHYASWSDDEETPDPDGETRIENPLLSWDDTSEEQLPPPTPPPTPTPTPPPPPEPDPKATPGRRARFRKVTGGVRETGGWDGEPGAPGRQGEPSLPTDPTGRYRFVAVVGEGAMGCVHRAEDHQLNRAVAYKVMSPDLVHQPALASKFTAEAQITAQLDHPGIVPVYDLTSEHTYTMKLVQGQTLRELLDEAQQRRRAQRDRLLELLARVCDTVAYAHSRGVIHRDLKPSNVMVGAYGEVYVMDWGIARVFDPDVERPVLVRDSEDEGELVIGTPGHMSPEQADGRNLQLDGASDQYALGLMLFEILTLSPAVTAKTSHALVVRQQEGELEPLVHRFRESIPRELRAIASKALAVDPGRRYPSVAALADDLRRFLGGQAVAARPDNILQRAGRWLARHGERTLMLVGLVLLCALLATSGAVGLAVWQHTSSQAREQRLATVLTTAARQASLVEGQFLKLEGLLSVISTAAGEALRAPLVQGAEGEQAPASTLVPTTAFTDAATAPPDAVERSASERYGPGLVSVRQPAFVIPDGATDPRWEALAEGARRHLPRVLLRSHSEQRATVTEAMARQTILDRDIPVSWAWIGLQDGLYLSYPGHGGLPADLDPRKLAAYQRVHDQQAPVWGAIEPHPSGRGDVLTVSQAFVDDDGATLGVAGLDVSLDWLVDKILLPEQLRGVPGVQALLLDDEGRVIVATDSFTSETYHLSEVVQAVQERRSGHVAAPGLLVSFNRMTRIGWTHVIEGDPEVLLGL